MTARHSNQIIDDTAENASPNGTPRWVKVFGVVALIVVVLVVVVMLVGGGAHGPGRHAGESPWSTQTA